LVVDTLIENNLRKDSTNNKLRSYLDFSTKLQTV
jgi:hypothetical protein